jgi:hypothetical protein
MVRVDKRLYYRYRELRALCSLSRATPADRRALTLLHISLFYEQHIPGMPIEIPHPLDALKERARALH